MRCNLQIEGSGVIPEDVIIDGGDDYENPLDPEAKPGKYVKHVVMRTDRSDGFVGRNFLLRGASEHGFYTEETDGILLDKVKFFWDARLRPPELHDRPQRDPELRRLRRRRRRRLPGRLAADGRVPPTRRLPRASATTRVVRRCDLRGSTLAYSGSMGNSVRITENHIYGNTDRHLQRHALGPRPPGLPGRRHARSTTTSSTRTTSTSTASSRPPVEPLVPMPIGTGHRLAGDERRHASATTTSSTTGATATLLAAVPDRGRRRARGQRRPGGRTARTTTISSTSCGNHYYDNVMGRPPEGFKFHEARRRSSATSTAPTGTKTMPNGVDFWWDEFAGNNGNCWYDNTGPTAPTRLDHRLRRGRRSRTCCRATATRASASATSSRRPCSSTARCTRAATRRAIIRSATGSGCRPSPGTAAARREAAARKRGRGRSARARAAASCKRGSTGCSTPAAVRGR